MIFIALGRWSGAHGRWFTRERIYYKGYRWTPFVRVGRRKSVGPRVKMHIEELAVNKYSYVEVNGVRIEVRGIDLRVMAGEVVSVTLYVMPSEVEASIELGDGAEAQIVNYEWYWRQCNVIAAERLLRRDQSVVVGYWPMMHLHLHAPVDDLGEWWRVAADYYKDGKRYGLRTEWHQEAKMSTPDLVETFRTLKSAFVPLDNRTAWLETSHYIRGDVLYEDTGDEENLEIADLPSSVAEAKQEATDGNQEE